MTRRRARHMRRVGEHMPCRTRRCMRHGTSNANGHGMPCDEGFPISAASTDTVGRIPPTCQHLMLRVLPEEGPSLFCTLLFQKKNGPLKTFIIFLLAFQIPEPSQQISPKRNRKIKHSVDFSTLFVGLKAGLQIYLGSVLNSRSPLW